MTTTFGGIRAPRTRRLAGRRTSGKVPSMITMKAKYAIKALARLALAPPGEPVLIADIAEREGIPKKFL